ncbi:MAG: exosortase-associated EpsI family protein [bacterium]|nr:exosortase-associated EpsI family protein [bacterium]
MTRRTRGMAGSVISVPFVVCLVALTGAVVVRIGLAKRLKVIAHKDPIHLRKPLAALDRSKLGDYRVVREEKLSAAVEHALGTKHYVNWTLEDRSVKRRLDPRKYVQLSISYYTGGANLVPHTPDVCRVGSGYQPYQPHENITLNVPNLGKEDAEVPVRVCTFVKTAIFHHDTPTVVYTFHTNGEFKGTRTGVRSATHRIADKYAYFSKVEVSFGGPQCQPRNLGRKESIVATAKLLNTLLPILIDKHWPDWEAARRPSATPGS